MKLDFQNTYKNVYFVGIGGISMSGLAEILNFRGVKVSGTDLKPSNVTKHLENMGILINYGHDGKNITNDINLVVYTAAVKEDNPELVAAKEKGILVIERSKLLGNIMDSYKKSIAISGTHGKTTTTSMLSEILLNCNADPTISIGGILPTIGGNTKIGNSDVFLAEACEYHNSFLEFHPHVGVILNVEAEHLDFFKDLEDVQNSFKGFAQNIPENGFLIINSETLGFKEITKDLKCTVLTYGLTDDAQWQARNIKHKPNGTNSFDVFFNDKNLGTLSLQVPGQHNILNALASCATACALGLSMEGISLGLNSYSGVNRRFQKKGIFNDILVIDDYAHHPTEVKATLSAAKNVEHNELWCIFQPHTYTRLKNLLSDFASSFDDADKIIVTDIYAAREKDTGVIHATDLVKQLQANGKNAQYISSFDDIVTYLKSTAQPNDMLITMGAGDVYLVGEALINK